jgi:hypothetical protein
MHDIGRLLRLSLPLILRILSIRTTAGAAIASVDVRHDNVTAYTHDRTVDESVSCAPDLLDQLN